MDNIPASEPIQVAQVGAPQIRTQEIVPLVGTSRSDALRIIAQNSAGPIRKTLHIGVPTTGGSALNIEVSEKALRTFLENVEALDVLITGDRITFSSFATSGR